MEWRGGNQEAGERVGRQVGACRVKAGQAPQWLLVPTTLSTGDEKRGVKQSRDRRKGLPVEGG